MGESRTELLAWLNDLLQTRYTKIEQAGTGNAPTNKKYYKKYFRFRRKIRGRKTHHDVNVSRCCLLSNL